MFINCKSGYDRSGNAWSRGKFLIMATPENGAMKPIRCFVRYVSMKQWGHWMMGSARIHNNTITLSGSYGSDGLPCTFKNELYEKGLELPEELYNLWKNGGGWNGAGSEASAIRDWAIANIKRLEK